ncbi:23S rRNA (uracil(1939)-C(5))-methyltransferase RlmD [Spirochaeta cellobiosiphila]|uniref:23S rRNA (uracil(1939)-C(5))-methyltransferase RlmD n=1 Tax=Spirochaeta cellobiosiphila TaxID=504483 RepID=UPI00040C030B|nr:23S rRNA (uracil(1939)-C(5))-methyltransferase RlmD [Spirochaeta cellobiosiphila]
MKEKHTGKAKTSNSRKQGPHPKRYPKRVSLEAPKKEAHPHSKNNSPCPYFKQCGGCQLLDRPYEQSLEYKNKKVRQLLSPFATVPSIIGMKHPWSYRNKMHSTFAYDKRKGTINGLYSEKSHKLVPIERCLIQDERGDKIVSTIKGLMKSFKMTAYNELNRQGFLRHILIKSGFDSGEMMVVLVVTTLQFPGKKNFIKVLRDKHPEITTIIQNVNDEDTTMVLGKRDVVLFGKGYIIDKLCGMTFQISAKSFYQINPVQTKVLYNKVLELAQLKSNETILDAYSGIGTIGLIASSHVKQVIGVELNGDAVKDAIRNAKRNKVSNAYFYEGDAGQFMEALAEEGHPLDVVFMDPPRSGSTPMFIQSLGKAKPRKVVYISCNPETLARDLELLKGEGYQTKKVQPVDMFPWTDHIEAVTLLEYQG